jgi:hypothetical protein
LMRLAGMNTLTVHATSQITFGQTKLRVALVLDNTGSMMETDSTGLSKISALKTATHSLLGMLQGAATTAGDVQVAIIPFSKAVRYSSASYTASWIDWTDFDSAPSGSMPSSVTGPGSGCPWSTSSQGYTCTSGPANGSSVAYNVPSSGSYAGYLCPGQDNGYVHSYLKDHYYNGCYNSVPTSTTGSSNTTTVCTNLSTCTTTTYCVGYPQSSTTTSGSSTTVTTTTCECHTTSGSRKTCTRTSTPVTTAPPYTHTWIPNSHSTWTGCFMDRTQSYDVSNTAASSAATYFPAENTDNCPGSGVTALGYNWTTLNSQVDAMSAAGYTNQPIGLAWGWQALSSGNPFNTSALPSDTQQVIIILSDGLNTMDRWYGNTGGGQVTQVDDRMTAICAAVKAAPNTTVYAVFVDLAGTTGNSSVMQSCATDSSKYFDLTTSASISTAFATIAQQITNLRVSQ